VGRLYAPNALAFALAFVTKKRWDDVNKGYLAGAPEIREYAALCLANGCEEFWVVDHDKKTVTVTRKNGQSVEYSKGMAVPLALLGDASLGVDPIFG
jgi:hypothetical protein